MRKTLLLAAVIATAVFSACDNSNKQKADKDMTNELTMMQEWDKVFLLSDKEWTAYGSQLKPVKCNWWLRTPGTQKDCAMFVDPYGAVMEAGYPVNAVMKVRPSVWVRY